VQSNPVQARPPEPTKASEPQSDPGDLIFVQENVFVMAPVIVHDLRGNIVNGLTPLDFELYDNGKLQKITEDATSHPISMVVAVQSSANMEKLLPDIRKIGSLFSGLVLGDTGEISVLSFDHRVQTMTEFTSDADKISKAFQNLKIGSTPSHLNDAAMKGVNMLRTRDKARRRILMLIGKSHARSHTLLQRVESTSRNTAHSGRRNRWAADTGCAVCSTSGCVPMSASRAIGRADPPRPLPG